jgi:hypothetical protein
MAFTPLVNGQSYSWSQITCNILGVDIAGITAISYTDTQEKQDNFGAGNRPVSRGRGNITTTGSVTLEMAEVEALQNVAPNRNILEIPPFDIIVSYLPVGGTGTVTHKLRNCEFKTNGREVNQNDMTIPVQLELLISHITW